MNAYSIISDSAKQSEVSGLGSSSVSSKLSRLKMMGLDHDAIISPQRGIHQLRTYAKFDSSVVTERKLRVKECVGQLMTKYTGVPTISQLRMHGANYGFTSSVAFNVDGQDKLSHIWGTSLPSVNTEPYPVILHNNHHDNQASMDRFPTSESNTHSIPRPGEIKASTLGLLKSIPSALDLLNNSPRVDQESSRSFTAKLERRRNSIQASNLVSILMISKANQESKSDSLDEEFTTHKLRITRRSSAISASVATSTALRRVSFNAMGA